MPRNWLLVDACVLLLLLQGCGGDRVKVAEVSGIVSKGGEPLEFVAVEFWPVKDGGKRSYGKTGSDGKFVLMTDDGKQTGASIGQHKVLLRDTWPQKDDYLNESGEMVDMSKGRKSRIDWKYYEVTTTPLSVEVKSGQANEFTFDVQ